jgi:hypothetical protein
MQHHVACSSALGMVLQHIHPPGTCTPSSASQVVALSPSHQRSRQHRWGGSDHYKIGQLNEDKV